ncbi:hypothetical protein B0H13DRAFT_1902827 [Mycena leptocephala]|nr:hypothetical protein B0H13DRAFT_1902827 [Mycena leptocephala]
MLKYDRVKVWNNIIRDLGINVGSCFQGVRRGLATKETSYPSTKVAQNSNSSAIKAKYRSCIEILSFAFMRIRINAGVDITDGDDVPEDEQDQEADDIDDDTGIALPDISDRWVAKAGVRADGEARLSTDAEEIWAYNPRGELWTKAGVLADESESGSDGEGPGSGDDYDANGDE